MMPMGLRTLCVPPQLLIHRAAVQFLNQYDELVEGSLGPGVKLSGYHLQVIGVSPAHQRKGAAAALMSYAQAKVRTTLAGDEPAISHHGNLGRLARRRFRRSWRLWAPRTYVAFLYTRAPSDCANLFSHLIRSRYTRHSGTLRLGRGR